MINGIAVQDLQNLSVVDRAIYVSKNPALKPQFRLTRKIDRVKKRKLKRENARLMEERKKIIDEMFEKKNN